MEEVLQTAIQTVAVAPNIVLLVYLLANKLFNPLSKVVFTLCYQTYSNVSVLQIQVPCMEDLHTERIMDQLLMQVLYLQHLWWLEAT